MKRSVGVLYPPHTRFVWTWRDACVRMIVGTEERSFTLILFLAFGGVNRFDCGSRCIVYFSVSPVVNILVCVTHQAGHTTRWRVHDRGRVSSYALLPYPALRPHVLLG
jgi:hypothetical protein